MSTLNSTNMSINRPTTKVLHAPGGGSSISFSFDDVPVGAKAAFNPSFDPSPAAVEEPAPAVAAAAPAPEAEPEPVATTTTPAVAPVVAPVVATTTTASKTTMTTAPAAAAAVAAAPVAPTPAGNGAVGVVCLAPATGAGNAAVKARTLAVLASRGVGEVACAEVSDPLQLPAAAKRMAASGRVAAVLVVGALTEETFASTPVAAAVVNGVVAASVAAAGEGCAVVPGFVYAATEKQAVAKAQDAPIAWVTSALALAKEEPGAAIAVVSTKTAACAAVTTPMEPAPAAAATPEKAMADLSITKGPSSAIKEPAGASMSDTPQQGRRATRGAGPSSIIFG